MLNTLVGIDNAAWLCTRAEQDFPLLMDDSGYLWDTDTLSNRRQDCIHFPLCLIISTSGGRGCSRPKARGFMKIKIGQAGSQAEMLERTRCVSTRFIKRATNGILIPKRTGWCLYYLDANGRYEQKDTFLKLDYTKKIGAYDHRIAIIEEPFPEEMECDVTDIPVGLVADEQRIRIRTLAETDSDGIQGHCLKPYCKTLSMTMKIAKLAQKNIRFPVFCAKPYHKIRFWWNGIKMWPWVAQPFSRLGNLSLLESRSLNYLQWDKMMDYHPQKTKNG